MLTSLQTSLHIFVSHSHTDNDFGVKLVDDLRQALGENSTIWYDAHGGLHGGDTWWKTIREELRSCNVCIVILSPDAVASSWVNNEIDIAWNLKNSKEGKLIIIPVLYRACEVRDDLNTLQIIGFLPPQSYDTAFTDLLTAIKVNTSQIPGQTNTISHFPQSSGTAYPPKHQKHLSVKQTVIVALTLALLIVISSLGFFYFKNNHDSPPLGIHATATNTNSLTPEDIYASATSGTPTFYDPLNGSLPSDFLQATATPSNPGGQIAWGCQLTANGYSSWAEQPGGVTNCWAGNASTLSDFAYQVQMTITRGNYGGMIFRYNGADEYRFSVGQDGTYDFVVTVNGDKGKGGNCCEKLAQGSSTAINQNLNQTNTLTVVARGNNIYLYINGIFINHVIDAHISSGQIGLFAYSYSLPTNVEFNNLKVWTL